MIAAHLRIASLTSTATIDPSALRELLHGRAGPASMVEHLRVRAGPRGADILAFVDSDDPETASSALHRLVSGAISDTPLLRRWRIL